MFVHHAPQRHDAASERSAASYCKDRARYEFVGRNEQPDEQRPSAGARNPDLTALSLDNERPEDPKFEHRRHPLTSKSQCLPERWSLEHL
jgi:hypothetical protein